MNFIKDVLIQETKKFVTRKTVSEINRFFRKVFKIQERIECNTETCKWVIKILCPNCCEVVDLTIKPNLSTRRVKKKGKCQFCDSKLFWFENSHKG